MIKKLLTIFGLTLAVSASAQNSGRVMSGAYNFQPETEITKSITYKAAALGCDTISTAQNASLQINTAGSDTTTPGCSPKAGFVFGTNCYGDLQKANYFPAATYSAITTPSVSAVLVAFFKQGTRGTGGAPTTTVGLNIYNPTNATGGGPSGAAIASASAPMSLVTAGASTTGICFYTYSLTTPVAVSATNGFYASITLPQGGGDTAVVFNSPASTIDYGYEQWSNNSWFAISAAWGASLKANLSIYPILCGNITTGISKSSLEKNVSVLPNPSTGLFNLILNFGQVENVSVSVTNVIGQEIFADKYNGITSFAAPIDLSSQANGVYLLTVTNGVEKHVQRIVLNK